MKITAEHFDLKFSMEIPDEIDLPDLVVYLTQLIRGIGYSFQGELTIDDHEE